jgi:membrane-associated progesterone receptor component
MVELTILDAFALALFIYIAYHYTSRPSRTPIQPATPPTQSSQPPLKSVMSAPRDDLDPPKDDLFTAEQLKMYDGSNSELPIYVAVKGKILVSVIDVQLLIT